MYHIFITIRASAAAYTAVMEYTDRSGIRHTKTLQGGIKSTANQNALKAAIDAVGIIRGACHRIEIRTDNDYLAGAVLNGWLKSWTENNWKNSKGNVIRHQEKWQQLSALLSRHMVRFVRISQNMDKTDL
jgi:ribonuclease HI